MGNFWIPHFDSSSSSPSSTRPSSPGIAQNTSNEGTHSGTGSVFSSRLDEVSPNRQILPTPNLRAFTFAELKKATENFSSDRYCGEGRFASRFKGWIDEKTFAPTKAGSGMAIAVKILKSYSRRGRKEWQREVNILGGLSHPNIVRLLGHCEEDKELLLVYEFIPGRSLEEHLFNSGFAFQTLSWSIRLKIAIGVARGLAFLHCSERKILQHNLTPYDVWIDSNYNAKISGLPSDCPLRYGENSHYSTCVAGTIAYIVPELFLTEVHRHLYVRSDDDYYCRDVLYEMLSDMQPGRGLSDRRLLGFDGLWHLVEWVEKYISDWPAVVERMMDPRVRLLRRNPSKYDWRLAGQYPSEGADQAARLILLCLSSDPGNRPSMTEVVEALEKIQAIKHDP